jgi:hypothetical protein
VIEPDQKSTVSVRWNFNQVAKGGDLRWHPIFARQVDKEKLKNKGRAVLKGNSKSGLVTGRWQY